MEEDRSEPSSSSQPEDEEDNQFNFSNVEPTQDTRQVRQHANLTFEATNATFTQTGKEVLKVMDTDFTDLVENINKKLFANKDKYLPAFSKFLQKSKDFDNREMNNPALDLYFTCRRVLIREAKPMRENDDYRRLKNRQQLLKQLFSHLQDSYTSASMVYYYEGKRNPYDRCFTFAPNSKFPYFHYSIKAVPVDNNHEHDSDYLVEKLFDFYLKICPRLHELASFLMFWAFKRGILSNKFISESAFKMLILVAVVVIENVHNVVSRYRDVHKSELADIKKCVQVGPGGKMLVSPQIQNYNKKYVIEYKRGFKMESGEFNMHPVVYTIDFPIMQNEVLEMKEALNEEITHREISLGRRIFNFFKYIATTLEKGYSLKLDLAAATGSPLFRDESSQHRYLDILHPVYGYNMTDNIRKDGTFHIVSAEFTRAFDTMKDGNITHIKENLCAPYRS